MLGPSGPRRLRLAVEHLAQMRGGLCFLVDLDPRWVNVLIRRQAHQELAAYKAHVVDQALKILRAHDTIRCLFATPRLLEALCEKIDLVKAGIRGVFCGGTEMDAQFHRFAREELVPGAAFVPTYGNTLMGLALCKPFDPADDYAITYHAPQPRAVIELVDPADPGRPVDYGETGRVLLTTLTREFFMPRFLERDEAERAPPTEACPGTGCGTCACWPPSRRASPWGSTRTRGRRPRARPRPARRPGVRQPPAPPPDRRAHRRSRGRGEPGQRRPDRPRPGGGRSPTAGPWNGCRPESWAPSAPRPARRFRQDRLPVDCGTDQSFEDYLSHLAATGGPAPEPRTAQRRQDLRRPGVDGTGAGRPDPGPGPGRRRRRLGRGEGPHDQLPAPDRRPRGRAAQQLAGGPHPVAARGPPEDPPGPAPRRPASRGRPCAWPEPSPPPAARPRPSASTRGTTTAPWRSW